MSLELAIRHYSVGESYLLKSNTSQAKKHFTTAANSYMEEASRRPGRESCRFMMNAAICLFNAGEYDRCYSTTGDINDYVVTPDERKKLEELRQQSKLRRSESYWKTLKAEYGIYKDGKQWQAMLDMLKDEPYLVPPGVLAAVRKECAEGLGNTELAKIFEKDLAALSKS